MSGGPGTREAFRASIGEALELLRARQSGIPPRDRLPDQPLPSLLARCQELVDRAERRGPAPIRTIHHLACTGGTLIARCVAAMPNVRLLSEVDPLSPLMTHISFVPSDVVRLARLAARPVGQETELDIFRAGLAVVLRDSRAHGLHLVLRDHAHGMFHHHAAAPDRPALRDILAGMAPLRSVVTVRHPLDSYLSLCAMGWNKHFPPGTLEDYCRGYHRFLDHHADLEILRYEDLLDRPEPAMQRICALLDLPWTPAFAQTFQAIRLSGDSGRGGGTLTRHPRRAIPEAIAAMRDGSAAYAALCARLGYDAADT